MVKQSTFRTTAEGLILTFLNNHLHKFILFYRMIITQGSQKMLQQTSFKLNRRLLFRICFAIVFAAC